jgi:hypothetical protein
MILGAVTSHSGTIRADYDRHAITPQSHFGSISRMKILGPAAASRSIRTSHLPQNSPSILRRKAYPAAWNDGQQPHSTCAQKIRYAAQKPRLGIFPEWLQYAVREPARIPAAAPETPPCAYVFHAGYPSMAEQGPD